MKVQGNNFCKGLRLYFSGVVNSGYSSFQPSVVPRETFDSIYNSLTIFVCYFFSASTEFIPATINKKNNQDN